MAMATLARKTQIILYIIDPNDGDLHPKPYIPIYPG